MRFHQIYCGNPGCRSRREGRQFDIFNDGIHLWEVVEGKGVDEYGKPPRCQGDHIADGELWLCARCRPVPGGEDGAR